MSKWKQKHNIMQRYNITANMYDARYADEQEAKYQAALKNLKLTCNSVILDVGCGTGLLFRHVAPKTETVVGIDISRNLLLHAKRNAKEHPQVHVVQADADHLPFRSLVFHVVFAFTVLQNMPKPLETLQEIKRTGKQEAFIVVSGLKKAFSLISFCDLLEQAGLQLVSFIDAEDLKCYIAVSIQKPK